jgi:hypothetical protein
MQCVPQAQGVLDRPVKPDDDMLNEVRNKVRQRRTVLHLLSPDLCLAAQQAACY